jgi:hypothetical protein
MALGREGARQKDKSLEHAELLFEHYINARTITQVFESGVIGGRLPTGRLGLRRRSLLQDGGEFLEPN